MAIQNERLKNFFSNQKIGAFDALKKVASPEKKAEQNIDQQVDPQPNIEAFTPQIAVPAISVSKPLANHEQTVSEPLANHKHIVSKPLANRKQTVSEPTANPLAIPVEKMGNITPTHLHAYSKKERELISLIFQHCHINGGLVSPPISTEEIKICLHISAERVRNLIHRIVKKGQLKVIQHKSGPSAFRTFEMSKIIYQLFINQVENEPKLSAEPLANPLASAIYSSSNKNKTTTELPEDWKQIKIDSLRDINFTENHIQQLYSLNVSTSEVVQDSINHFSFGLQNKGKPSTYPEPLNVLMGVLRKGNKWTELGYISPKDQALQQIVAEKKKAKEHQESMLKDLLDLEFPSWKKQLTESQTKMIVSQETLRSKLQPAIDSELRKHYMENIIFPRLEREGIL